MKIGYFNSHHEIKLDRDFSLFENPNRVLLNLREMFEYARKKNKFAKLKYNGHGSFGALKLWRQAASSQNHNQFERKYFC